jgi:hypothetical protein
MASQRRWLMYIALIIGTGVPLGQQTIGVEGPPFRKDLRPTQCGTDWAANATHEADGRAVAWASLQAP